MKKIDEGDVFLEDILDSLNGIDRAEAPAFFYTRLMARIDRQKEYSSAERILGFISRPVFAMATLSLFVILNVMAITTMMKTQFKGHRINSVASLESFAQEYDLSVSTLYTDTKGN